MSTRVWVGAACVVSMLGGCTPAPGIPTTDPSLGAGSPGTEVSGVETAPSTAGTVLRYDARAATLQQRGQLEMVQRGAGQYAEAVVDLSATIEIVPAQERLKVVWALGRIESLELRGALQVDDGSDPKAFLLAHGRGAYYSDLRGQAEDDPTLPENAEREAKLASMREAVQAATEAGTPAPVAPGLQMLSYLPPLVQLPSLPEEPLPLNEPVKVEREEETELGDTGLLLPFYVTMTYTLVNIDTSGGDRLAEMTFTGSAIGSQEGPGGEIVIESQQKGTLLFNLDKQLPVSYESTRTESYEMGQFSGEAETTLRASWDV